MIKEILFRQLHPKTVRQVLYVVYAVMLLITWHYASLVMEFQKITPAKLIHVFSETRQAEAASVTISGTVYTNQGVTTMGSGRTVRILKNGTDMSKSTTTNGFGAFSISSVNTSAEDVLTVYLDNATENGAVVTLSNATDIADLNIYQNYLITRTESGTALTNANLDTANNADPGLSSDDLTSLYDVSGGTLTTTTGTELLIKNSFTPGGAIDAGGTIDVDGLFDASTYAINVAGDWDISVMITHSGNLTFDGTGAQVYTNSTSMNSTMVINKSSGTLTAASWLKPMTGNITLTSGTLDINGQAITGNSLIVGAAGILKLQGGESVGTPTLNAGSTVLYSNSLGEYTLSNWNYGNLTINASGATYNAPFPTFMVGGNFTMTAGTFTGNSTVIFLSGNLDLDGGTFTSTTNELRLAGNFDNSAGAPLAFNANSGTVTLNGNGQSILGATTFATLTKTGADTATAADRTLTFVNGQTTTATTLNLNGFSNAEPLLLRSNSSGLNASVTATTTNASKLDIKDVYHLNGPIDPANSTNGGNANGWFTVSILTVTAGNIAASLTTDNGTFGVAGINDILTITWNAVSGDSNTLSDIGTVRANLSNFGGGATESLYDNQTNGDVTSGDGIFTRAFTIPAGSTDAVARSFTITATNTESTATGPVTENTTFTVDNIAPTVSVACISVTGATGTNGLFKYRDTPILRWDNSNLGSGCTNNNSDIASVAFNAANFKAADTNRAGSVASNVWTASLSGAMDTQSDTNNNVTVTATDDAGNATSLAGTNNYTIYTFFPILALTNIVSPTSDVMPRNTVQYTFTITNSGTGNSPNAIFTSTLTSGATFSGGSDTYTTSYPSITPNETKTISLSAVVGSPPSSTVVNTATVTDDEASSVAASAAFVMWQSKSGGTSSGSLRQIMDKYFTKKTDEAPPIEKALTDTKESSQETPSKNDEPLSPSKDSEEKKTEDNFMRISEAPPTLKESGDEEALFPKIIYIERKDLANDLEKIEALPNLSGYTMPQKQEKIAATSFPDTKPDHTYYKSAVALYDQGIIQGYKDGSLKLDANITREEVAKIIVRASQTKIPGKFTAGFRDAKAKEWYVPYINYVANEKIMEGYKGNTFGVGKKITLAETMKVIVQGFKLSSDAAPNYKKGHWAQNYYDFLHSKNLVSSDFYDSKKWDKPVTRGQIFDIIYRTLFMEDGGRDEFVDTIRMTIPVLDMKDVLISRTLLSDASVWARDLAIGGGFYEVPDKEGAGTLIIFAHSSPNQNTKNPNENLFQPLVDSLKIADSIELNLNGKTLLFTLESREKAREDEVEKIKNAPKDISLILFTSAEDPGERWIFMGKSASSI